MSIFVSLACYRDPEIVNTIIDCFNKAKNPLNIFVGVLLQHKEEDENFVEKLEEKLDPKYFDNIHFLKLKWYKARGPIYARYIIFEKLYKNQKYYLQLDSHSRFSKNWDMEYINMLESLEEPENSILSTYPHGYHIGKELTQTRNINIMKMKGFREGIPIFTSYSDIIDKPLRNYFWAAGNSFSYGEIFKRVPIDPHLKNLFWGEEFLASLRFYTHGINIYTPHKNIIYTLWSREHRPVFWEIKDYLKDKYEILLQSSLIRLRYIAGLIDFNKDRSPLIFENIDKYSLGTKRTMENYYKESKIIDNYSNNIN